MAETRTSVDRRCENVALSGLVIQVATFAVLALVTHWAGGSDAIRATAVFASFGILVWAVLYVVFKQLRRVQAEELETAELKRARASGTDNTLFETEREDLFIEQGRLKWMVKWLLPATTVILFLQLYAHQFGTFGWSFERAFQPAGEGGVIRTDRPTLWMWFVVFTGFVCFLFARYTLALAKLRAEWEVLRAGATCMAANAIACLLLSITLMAGSTIDWIEPLYAYVIRAAMLIVAIELTLNFVLDFYRPRTRRIIPRPSFDSRLLGLVGEPGGIAKSIADAINYQFGFEVSTTWFYQLLRRWFLPLVVTTFLIIVLLTSIVIVDADEMVVVERFGEPWRSGSAPVVLEPGVHLKWPYPAEIAHRVPVTPINEMTVGEATKPEEGAGDKAILWTVQHEYVPELMLLVAAPDLTRSAAAAPGAPEPGTAASGKSISSSLLMVSVPIQYRIHDINAYLYKYQDVEKIMEAVVYQIVSDYASGVDIDEMIGPGREAFNKDLRVRFQKRLNELGLGVELIFVGIRGAHPPAQEQVAAAFQQVISAETRMTATINAAQGYAQRLLIESAGSVDRAHALDEAIVAKNAIDSDANATEDQRRAARERIDELLVGNPAKNIPPISGEAAVMLGGARNRATQLVTDAMNKARAFGAEVAAYEAAPKLYKIRKSLEVYRGMDMVRKYLIVGDPKTVIIEFSAEDAATLDTVLQEGLDKEQSR